MLSFNKEIYTHVHKYEFWDSWPKIIIHLAPWLTSDEIWKLFLGPFKSTQKNGQCIPLLSFNWNRRDQTLLKISIEKSFTVRKKFYLFVLGCQ